MAKVDKDVFGDLCVAVGLPRPTPEYQFAKDIGRRWKTDWAWVPQKIALELEGGAFKGHGHRSVGKFLRDMEKYNTLSIRGWRLLRVTTKDMNDGTVFDILEQILR